MSRLIKPAPKRAKVEGSGTGAGPLAKGTMLTSVAKVESATGFARASAAGVAVMPSTPGFPGQQFAPRRCSRRVSPPRRVTQGTLARRRSKRPSGAGHCCWSPPACRTRRSCRPCRGCRGVSLLLPRTSMPPPALSITLSWPGPERIQAPMPRTGRWHRSSPCCWRPCRR